MKIQFTDLKKQFLLIEDRIKAAIDCVLSHGQFIMGPEIDALENRLAAFVGVKHAITCSSGTDALMMPLMAYGVGPGDIVLTTPFTFIATSEVISLLGATPVFVDIDLKTFNIDPAKLEDKIKTLSREKRGKVRGVIPVDLFGLPADYDAIIALAKENDIFVLEDAAQSLGAVYKGMNAGSLAEVAATSFFPSKPLGCYGDGGAIFTSNDSLAESLKSIRVHGQGKHKYDNVRVGMNARLDTLQAAVLLEKLAIFPDELKKRNEKALYYSQALKTHVVVPHVPETSVSAWAQYSILVDNRDELQEALKNEGVPTAVYYQKPLHLQVAYQSLNYSEGDFPHSEIVSKRILSLPIHSHLTREEQDFIIEKIIKFARIS